jgi:hypothetical protein
VVAWYKSKDQIHLTSWDLISKPKDLGIWGIKYLKWFNIALILKTVWKGICGSGLWGEIIKAKYLRKINLIDWIRCFDMVVVTGSIVWRGFVNHFHWIGHLIS